MFVFCMRCRARIAPPVVEAENELSFQDEFLPSESPVRRRSRSRARGRPRIASCRRQRDLRDDEPAEQDDVNAKFVAETPQDPEPISPAVLLI